MGARGLFYVALGLWVYAPFSLDPQRWGQCALFALCSALWLRSDERKG